MMKYKINFIYTGLITLDVCFTNSINFKAIYSEITIRTIFPIHVLLLSRN